MMNGGADGWMMGGPADRWMDGVYHLIEELASKSFRLSAMLIDSSISGSFFCRNGKRCNRFPH